MAELITMSEFARRVGVSPQAISRAVQSGRLTTVPNEKGRPRLDAEAAKEEWQRTSKRNNKQSSEDDLSPKLSYYDVRAVHEEYKARLARLKYEEEKGQLVRTDDVRLAVGKIINATKSKMLSVPAKAKIRLPNLSLEDVDALEEMIREALTDLATWRLENAE